MIVGYRHMWSEPLSEHSGGPGLRQPIPGAVPESQLLSSAKLISSSTIFGYICRGEYYRMKESTRLGEELITRKVKSSSLRVLPGAFTQKA